MYSVEKARGDGRYVAKPLCAVGATHS